MLSPLPVLSNDVLDQALGEDLGDMDSALQDSIDDILPKTPGGSIDQEVRDLLVFTLTTLAL